VDEEAPEVRQSGGYAQLRGPHLPTRLQVWYLETSGYVLVLWRNPDNKIFYDQIPVWWVRIGPVS
jgi:hypothetical protein